MPGTDGRMTESVLTHGWQEVQCVTKGARISSLRSEASQGATAPPPLRLGPTGDYFLAAAPSLLWKRNKRFRFRKHNPDCAGQRPTTEVDKGFHGRSQAGY